ncbi:hypothetical protein HanLR1_Chr01g0019661 [Helianthus annuus]|nr:hypothetical protein HanLR1_Chr01g0019661 [Helianthus annuus]
MIISAPSSLSFFVLRRSIITRRSIEKCSDRKRSLDLSSVEKTLGSVREQPYSQST